MNRNAALSRRESQVAEMIAWGAAKKEIADRFFISERTVENTARVRIRRIEIEAVAKNSNRVSYYRNKAENQ